MKEKDPLEALHDGHQSLRRISNAIRDAAYAFRELADAVTVLLIFIDGHGILLMKEHQKAVDRVRAALDKVTP